MPYPVERLLAVMFVVGLVVLGPPAGVAWAQWTLYADFNQNVIDPELFSASSVEGGGGSPTAEVLRVAQGRALEMALVSYGGTASDVGVVTTRQQLNLKVLNPFIIGLQAKVTVLAASAENCVANPAVGNSGARLGATFFNDGTNIPGSAVGNAFAQFQLVHNSDSTHTIFAQLFRCTSADCSAAGELPGSPVDFTTSWSFKKAVVMEVVWEQALHQVRYTATSGANSETQTMAYTLSDTTPPAGFDNKQVRVSNFAENCVLDRTRNFISAKFDDVSVMRVP